jgi:hypothetical protein
MPPGSSSFPAPLTREVPHLPSPASPFPLANPGIGDVMLDTTQEVYECSMTRKLSTEPIKRLTIEFPESEYPLLEAYCLCI